MLIYLLNPVVNSFKKKVIHYFVSRGSSKTRLSPLCICNCVVLKVETQSAGGEQHVVPVIGSSAAGDRYWPRLLPHMILPLLSHQTSFFRSF